MPAPRPSILSWIAVMLLSVPALTCGQAPLLPAQPPPPEPPALTALRVEFLGQIVTASRQLTEQFTNALAKLEDELVTSGDYEDALAVYNRRREIESSISQSPAPPANPGVPLPANTARTTSAVTLDVDALTGWRTSGSYAEWALQKLTPGRYTVQLSYILTDLPVPDATLSSRFAVVEVAKFKLTEVSLLAAAAANTRLFELPRSKDATVYATVSSEPIAIARSTFTLRLEALQGYAANAIRIKDIRLVPVEDKPTSVAPVAGELPASGEKDLQTLKERFLKQLADARAPLITDYQARLKTLAAQPSVTKNAELLEQIDAEQKRASDTTKPLLGGPVRPKRDGSSSDGGLDGFEDISGVKLVDDPANTAERFKVEHEGRQFWIKLAWVRPLPASPDERDALQAATKHFKIDEDEALTVGREARNFALGYLEGRPLRLLVRGKKNADRAAAPALVYLDDISLLFQLVLIDNGFASFSPPPGNDRKPTSEMAMMKLLSDHEQQAMKRNPAPGAWSFRKEEAR